MQLKGLRLDSKFSDSAAGTWAYAKNVLLSRGFDEIENEPGDSEYIATLTNHKFIGRIVTPNEVILFLWNTSNTKTYIKKVSATATVVDLISGGTTFFNINPSVYVGIYIEGVYYYNSDGELIIAWTTGFHKPMIMNTSAAITISSDADLKQLYLFPEFEHNNFNLAEGTITGGVINGGNLPAAAYFLALTYELEPEVNTNFGVISNPIFITLDDTLTSYKQFKGNASLVQTSKAIIANVSNLDTDYSYFKIAVIQKTEQSIQCFITKRYRIASTGVNVIIDDLDNLTLFNLNEVVISSPAYSLVKSITQSNKRLRLYNLTKPTKLSLDDIYDNILTPRTISVSSASRNGTTVTVTTSAAHNLTNNDIVTMNGWSVAAYNGHFVVTVSGPSVFTYTTTTGLDSATDGTCKTDILTVNWVNDTVASLSTTKNSYKDSVFIFNKRGFRSDEVYALYLGLRLKTGGYYGIYHIPGREALGTENSAQTTVDGDAIDNYKLTSSASKQGNYYGKMGFWENENETYGNKYGDNLGNNKVRHHRFPSAGQLHGWKGGVVHTVNDASLVNTISLTPDEFNYSTNGYYGALTNNKVGSLGDYTIAGPGISLVNTYTAKYNTTINLNFDIDYQVIEYSGTKGSAYLLIKKYKKNSDSTYTESTIVNLSQVATTTPELITLSCNEDIELNTGDYITIEVSCLSAASDGGFVVSIEQGNGCTISEYEATSNQEILGLRIALDWNNIPIAIRNSLSAVVDGWEILYAKRTLNDQLMLDQSLAFEDGIGYRFHGFDSMANNLNIIPSHIKAELNLQSTDYTDGAYIKEITNYTLQTAVYSEVNLIKYLPAYSTATVPSNENKENCYYFETESGSFDKRLVNFINIKNDVYLNFSNQELVSTGVIKSLGATSAFSLYGGDNYVGHNSVLRFVLNDDEDIVPSVWYFPVESILNTGMRYEGENEYEKFFPLTDITVFNNENVQTYIQAMQDAGIANYYIYSNLYHLLNTLRQDSIDDDLTNINTYYPNRIQSSIPQPLESSSKYWHKYKILDYFDIPTNKGAIYKALGNDYITYIQTEFSIYRGIVMDKLRATDIDIALKSTDMFDRPLEELHDADGNYIKPWNREGTILTPYGLIVVDLNRGSVYQISDKLNEISKLGIEDWFRTTVKTTMAFDTKETIGSGVILGYDDLYKRLLVTIKNSNTSIILNLTLSFQFETGLWIAFHSYTPDKYIWNSNGMMYAIETGGNTIFRKMFTGNYGYYNSVYNYSIIDWIFNDNKNRRFLLKSFKWTSNLYKSGINYWNSTIHSLLFYSKNLCSEEITVVKKEYTYGSTAPYVLQEIGNTLYQDGEWIFNDIKDYLTSPNLSVLDNNFDLVTASLNLSKNWYDKSQFITKFVIARMKYLNDSNNYQLRISNVDIDVTNVL
jgi:hypothetical protein